MPDFRYAQSCALARATELLGERWTLLIVRELLIAPRTFTELRAALPGITSSILTRRLQSLANSGVLSRASAGGRKGAHYLLTDTGLELKPAVLELIRWGARFLVPLREQDQLDAAWLLLAFEACARRSASPAVTFAIVVEGQPEVQFTISGGAAGTQISPEVLPGVVTVTAPPALLLALMAGRTDPLAELATGRIQLEGGCPEMLQAIPLLFES